MRTTKSNSTKPLARSSPRDDNPRARHSPIDDLTKMEGSASFDNNNDNVYGVKAGTALTEDAQVPMLTDAQQQFFNDAIAQTRRQTLLEHDIIRDEERHTFQQQLQYMQEQMAHMKQEQQAQIATMMEAQRTSSSVAATSKHAFETPKAQRPQDKEYQALLTANKDKPIHEHAHTMNYTSSHTVPQQPTQDMIQQYDTRMTTLLSSVGNILKHSKKEDTTELPKFLGGDSQWPKWYQLLRAYLQARGWLTTFDHPIGPGTLQTPTPE